VLLIDGEPEKPIEALHPELAGRIVYQVPMERIAKKEVGEPKAKNMVAVGAATALFGFSRELIERQLTERFRKRGEKTLADNLKAFTAGFDFASKNIEKRDPYCLTSVEGKDLLVISGNEASALGAVYAGCRFFAGYPITPASEIMELLAHELPLVGGAMVQAEDEIASMGMVLGGAFAGVRSMTATSGPGLSLMAELIGLASMAEVPCVIVNVQRGGPSTGLPTKTEQADLTLALAASHGDAPHVLLAPLSVRDCFEIMDMAFEIAEAYQIPVIVLSEQALGFRKMDLPQSLLRDHPRVDVRPVTAQILEDVKYLRYQITENGISPRTVPGQRGGAHVATGLEHAEDGKPAYDPSTRIAMMEKRQRKLDGIVRDYASVARLGYPKPEIGLFVCNSTADSIQDAVETACASGIRAAGLIPRLIYPSPNDEIRSFVASCKKVIVAEGNMTGQYAAFLRSQVPGFDPLQLNRYDGLPVTPAEVLAKIQEVAS
jgi:2-oxoglutarate ferredoxin oxidoreductase subunit alpha